MLRLLIIMCDASSYIQRGVTTTELTFCMLARYEAKLK